MRSPVAVAAVPGVVGVTGVLAGWAPKAAAATARPTTATEQRSTFGRDMRRSTGELDRRRGYSGDSSLAIDGRSGARELATCAGDLAVDAAAEALHEADDGDDGVEQRHPRRAAPGPDVENVTPTDVVTPVRARGVLAPALPTGRRQLDARASVFRNELDRYVLGRRGSRDGCQLNSTFRGGSQSRTSPHSNPPPTARRCGARAGRRRSACGQATRCRSRP